MTFRAQLVAMLAGAAALSLVALGAAGARAYASFQASCTNEYYWQGPAYRSSARIYAQIAQNEGYQWGGGCWNDNDVDDAPGDPTETYSGGEGADCSGFTFKVWRERLDTSDAGWTYHYRMRNVHGPYDTYAYKAGQGAPNTTVAKAAAISMDAFASNTHIGLVYQANTAYNVDQIVEAKGEAWGTGIWSRTYRGDSAYSGVRRVGWAG